MHVVLGIDIGGSTTKIVGYTIGGEPIGMMQVDAADQLTSVYGAFGKFTAEKQLRLSDIEQIVLTGVGASYVQDKMYDLPTKRVDEFTAIGLGGLALVKHSEAIIVSMGTGTFFIQATKNSITHLGGSGVGGGTLLNLCNRFAGASSIETITELAAMGCINNVDLSIGDISRENVGHFPPEITASNFGNLKDTATNADIVLGIINMIFETIGMMAVFAAQNGSIFDIILTGSLTRIPQAKKIFDTFHIFHPVRFHIPENAIYATAVGAALSHINR
ncbi:MAG: pantothenate kinase [Defluviitaleaceae bacterium]|nr:pantothenate kinase [Defluviitaleaceae bacterium]